MRARLRDWICLAVVLALFASGLAAGCRNYNRSALDTRDAVAGAESDAGTTGVIRAGAGAGGAPLLASAGAGAGAGGAEREGAGAGGEAGNLASEHIVELSVDVAEPFVLDGTWSELMPFVEQGAPHFLAYWKDTGASQFRGLQADRRTTSTLWQHAWFEGLTFSRLALGAQERFALYEQDTGKRLLMTFEPGLTGPVQIDPDEVQIAPGFTHHASDFVPSVGLPFLYWYDASSGRLRGDMLNGSATKILGGFVGTLAKGYRSLGAVDGRLLGLHEQSADVFEFSALGTGANPSVLSGLGKTERMLAFKLEEWSLLYCYSLDGPARLLQLIWSEGSASVTEVWSGRAMVDAQLVSGVALPHEYLIFAYDPVTTQLQLISVTL